MLRYTRRNQSLIPIHLSHVNKPCRSLHTNPLYELLRFNRKKNQVGSLVSAALAHWILVATLAHMLQIPCRYSPYTTPPSMQFLCSFALDAQLTREQRHGHIALCSPSLPPMFHLGFCKPSTTALAGNGAYRVKLPTCCKGSNKQACPGGCRNQGIVGVIQGVHRVLEGYIGIM